MGVHNIGINTLRGFHKANEARIKKQQINVKRNTEKEGSTSDSPESRAQNLGNPICLDHSVYTKPLIPKLNVAK